MQNSKKNKVYSKDKKARKKMQLSRISKIFTVKNKARQSYDYE